MSLNGCLGNSEIGGCKEIRQPFANPSPTLLPTLCQPFANLSPTLCQPFLPTPLQPRFPWTPGTGLETRVSGLLVRAPHTRPAESQVIIVSYSFVSGLLSTGPPDPNPTRPPLLRVVKSLTSQKPRNPEKLNVARTKK